MCSDNVCLRDCDSHDYSVPKHLVERFNELMNAIYAVEAYSDAWYDACDNFNDEFSDYRV
jgi:hypothetical protein